MRLAHAAVMVFPVAVAVGCWSDARPRPGSGSGSGGTAGVMTVTSDVGPVTTCAGTDATYLAPASLPAIAPLPDPFTTMEGTRIGRQDQWPCRRAEIAAQAQVYELGPKPAKPASVTGAVDAQQIAVTASEGGKTISFTAALTVPATGTPPYPAMIGIGGVSIGATQLAAMGVATINFPNGTIAEQNNSGSRGKGLFYDLYGASHGAGAMMAWAWGVSRLIDVLEQTPASPIDPARLGVTGCSRNGKGALIAGAFDERIKLTIPQESGSGGSASWRVSDAQDPTGQNVQTLREIVGENVWFRSSFGLFAGATAKVPFDHHEIEALIAPRALLVIENTSQVWLGSVSTFTSSTAAHTVWEALGVADHMGFSQKGDHMHCEWNGSQQAEVTAYVQKFLIGGGTADTNVLETDGSYGYDKATWQPWDVPALSP